MNFTDICHTQMIKAFFHTQGLEAGIDEAGRGSYAGPVFAAAVILPRDFYHALLNDSKQLSEKQRDLLRPIIEKESIAFAVAAVDNLTIDKINILQATFKAMHMALDGLNKRADLILVDGNRFKAYKNIRHECIIRGDSAYSSIAAASILAKTYRDEFMKKLHQDFPQYCWDRNKGYGTSIHREAITKYGLCKYHRKSYHI